jgi:hypothetical protein
LKTQLEKLRFFFIIKLGKLGKTVSDLFLNNDSLKQFFIWNLKRFCSCLCGSCYVNWVLFRF